MFALMMMLSLHPAGIDPGDALQRAFAARDILQSGEILVLEIREIDNDRIERLFKATFDVGHYRLDVISDSEFDKLCAAVNGAQAKGSFPTPSLTIACDGFKILQREFEPVGKHPMYKYSVRRLHEASIPDFNPRCLGLPGPGEPCPLTDLRRLYRLDGQIVDHQDSAGVHTVFVEQALASGKKARVSFSIDETKGGLVVGYQLEVDPCVVRGQVLPAQFDGHWFPSWVRVEQYCDGQFNWAHEYHVLDAKLNCSVGPEAFDWSGMGIGPRNFIDSRVPGQSSAIWDGKRAVPFTEFSDVPAKATPEPRKSSMNSVGFDLPYGTGAIAVAILCLVLLRHRARAA